MSDYSELKRLAEAATPGPWKVEGEAVEWQLHQGPFDDTGASIVTVQSLQYVIGGGSQDEQGGAVGVLRSTDAEFIAAASPAVILALLTELETLREMHQKLLKFREALT